jgi:hypothetical protein
MPELTVEHGTLVLHSLHHRLPSLYLLLVEHARSVRVPAC